MLGNRFLSNTFTCYFSEHYILIKTDFCFTVFFTSVNSNSYYWRLMENKEEQHKAVFQAKALKPTPQAPICVSEGYKYETFTFSPLFSPMRRTFTD